MPANTTTTAEVRYAARSDASPRPNENEAGPVWADNLEALYLTDPDRVAAVLPPPLEPGSEPLLRFAIATWELPTGELRGEARLTVQANHGATTGEYPLVVMRSTEGEVIEAREMLGEPAKLAEITSKINNGRIENKVDRLGHTVGRIIGTVEAEDRPSPTMRTEFTYRVVRSANDPLTLGRDPELIAVRRTIEERRAAIIGGFVRLGQSPKDPVCDLPVRNTLSLRLSQQLATSTATPLTTVPADDFQPFLHQRYDDLAVLDRWR